MRYLLSSIFTTALVFLSPVSTIHTHSRAFEHILQQQQQQQHAAVNYGVVSIANDISDLKQDFTAQEIFDRFCLEGPGGKHAKTSPNLARDELFDQTKYKFTKNCGKDTYAKHNKAIHMEWKAGEPTHWGFMMMDVGGINYFCQAANYVPKKSGEFFGPVAVEEVGGATHTEKHCLNSVILLLLKGSGLTIADFDGSSALYKSKDGPSKVAQKAQAAYAANIKTDAHFKETITFAWCNAKTMCGACTTLYGKVREGLTAAGFRLAAQSTTKGDELCQWK